MKMNIVKIITIALLVGAVGFFGGIKYQQSKGATTSRQAGGSTFVMRGGEGSDRNAVIRGGLKPVSGEIIASDDKSITVKLQDGSSRIVILSEKTQINKAEEAEKSELKQGEAVAVFGTENQDGSVTAQNIQLNPGSQIRMK